MKIQIDDGIVEVITSDLKEVRLTIRANQRANEGWETITMSTQETRVIIAALEEAVFNIDFREGSDDD